MYCENVILFYYPAPREPARKGAQKRDFVIA